MSSLEIEIREATDLDLGDITTLLNSQIVASAFVYAEVEVTLEDRRAWLSHHRAAGLPVLVATSERRVVGWASLSPYRTSSGYRLTAEPSVYVASIVQRRGIASRLLNALLDRARALGLHVLIASIDSANLPSIALFERFGFKECARLPEVGRKFGEWRTQLLLYRAIDDARS